GPVQPGVADVAPRARPQTQGLSLPPHAGKNIMSAPARARTMWELFSIATTRAVRTINAASIRRFAHWKVDMRETHAKPDRAWPPLAASRNSALNQSWENEGGATQQSASTERPAVVEPARTDDPTPPELAAIDAISGRGAEAGACG